MRAGRASGPPGNGVQRGDRYHRRGDQRQHRGHGERGRVPARADQRGDGRGYASFVAGYAGTGRQVVTKVSVSADQVSFTLSSDNPDGTVQMFSGTDTVTGGKIVAAHVVQTSGQQPA